MTGAASLSVEVDYTPVRSGVHMWRAFDAGAVAADFTAIAATGIPTVRVGLAWDAFMPSDREVSRRRLGELETLLRTAASNSLRVVPVLFVQSHAGYVLLPAYAVRRDAARPGVRVLSEGRLEPGGPRDVWTDPLMLELAERWLRALLRAFAGHPAIAAWDLGHDPASTVRPVRIEDLARWVGMFADVVHEQGEQVRLTLGAADVTTARGVRLDALAPALDRLDVHAPLTALEPLGGADAASPLLLTLLARRLAGGACPAGVALALPVAPEDPDRPPAGPGLPEPAATRLHDELLGRLDEAGAAAVRTAWQDVSGPVLETRPYRGAGEWQARCGLRGPAGPRPWLERWTALAREGRAVAATEPWPPVLDIPAYYAELPGSLLDLVAEWRRERPEPPAILG